MREAFPIRPKLISLAVGYRGVPKFILVARLTISEIAYIYYLKSLHLLEGKMKCLKIFFSEVNLNLKVEK